MSCEASPKAASKHPRRKLLRSVSVKNGFVSVSSTSPSLEATCLACTLEKFDGREKLQGLHLRKQPAHSTPQHTSWLKVAVARADTSVATWHTRLRWHGSRKAISSSECGMFAHLRRSRWDGVVVCPCFQLLAIHAAARVSHDHARQWLAGVARPLSELFADDNHVDVLVHAVHRLDSVLDELRHLHQGLPTCLAQAESQSPQAIARHCAQAAFTSAARTTFAHA